MHDPNDFDAAMRIAREPALLADTGRAAVAAMRARDAAAEEAQRTEAALRWAELARRGKPEETLKTLDGLGEAADVPAGRRTRLNALLDLGRFDDARAVGPSEGSTPADGLLAARLAYVLDRTRALALADAALEAADDPEVRADLLCLRARWRAEAGDPDGAVADADALIALCEAHGADASRLMAELMRLGFETLGRASPEARLDEAIEGITDGIPMDVRALGPVPPHVHGLMVRYAKRARDPKAFVLGVLTVADLASAAQRFETAFETLVDGAELARRVFGERVAVPVEARYRALAERLGPERIAALYGWRRRRTEMLLRRTDH